MHAKTEKNPYFLVWMALLVLTCLSGAASKLIGHSLTLTFIIFLIAAVKSSLVGGFFMHLRKEPLIIWVGVFSGLAVVVMVYLGLIPDIVYQFGRIAQP